MQETKVLGIRFSGSKEMKSYNQVKELADENKLFMSGAGKLLINRGLQHTNNPEPLVKPEPKVITKIVPQLVYVNRPDNTEHIGESQEPQQHLSGDKLMTGNKADLSPNALEVKKSPPEDREDFWAKVVLYGLGGSFIVYKVYDWFTA